MQLNDPLQLVCQVPAPIRLAAAISLVPQILRVTQMVHTGQQGPEQLAVRRNPAHRNAAETDAVVALLAADQSHPLTLATHPVPGNRDLQRRIDRFGAGIGKEHAGQVLGRHLRQPVGQLEGARIAHLKGRVVIQLRRLLLDRRNDMRMAMPRAATPKPRHAIEHLPPVVCRVIHTLGLAHEAGVTLELTVGRKRHPIRLQIGQLVGHTFVRIHGRVAYQRKARAPTPGNEGVPPSPPGTRASALTAGNEGVPPSPLGTRASRPRRRERGHLALVEGGTPSFPGRRPPGVVHQPLW